MVAITREPAPAIRPTRRPVPAHARPVGRRVTAGAVAARLMTAVAAAVFLLGAGLALVGATKVGISTDEPLHQARINVWFDTGWYVPARFFDEAGAPKPGVETGRWHSYGAGYSSFGHVVAVLAGAEEWGTTNRSGAAYSARGVAVALLGIAAAIAVGFATAVLTASRRAGLWAAAAAMAMPLWAGYSMFAVKDVPAAAGWTFVTAGLVVALHRAPGRWRRRIAIAALCAVGIWFSIGVRTALWVAVAAAVMVFAVLAAARWRQVRGNVLAVVGGLAVGFAAVAALHYRNSATPVTWLVSAVRTSGDFPWSGTTLTAGRLVAEKPPWWYLPAWIGGSTPLLLGTLAAVGAVVAVAVALRRPGSGGVVAGRLRSDGAAMTLWGLQALLLPVVATLGGATMYAGLRHHLYVLPALAALAGFAAARLLRAWGGRWLVPVLLAAALVAPAVEQLQLFPYQFVYKNAAAGPINGRWETDMHFVSGREAVSRVPAGAELLCYTKPREPLQPRDCSRQRQLRPYIHEQGSRAGAANDPATVWVVGRNYRGGAPPAECDAQASVTRRLRGEDVAMTYVLRCPASPNP